MTRIPIRGSRWIIYSYLKQFGTFYAAQGDTETSFYFSLHQMLQIPVE